MGAWWRKSKLGDGDAAACQTRDGAHTGSLAARDAVALGRPLDVSWHGGPPHRRYQFEPSCYTQLMQAF
jgi:hypothetical protein